MESGEVFSSSSIAANTGDSEAVSSSRDWEETGGRASIFSSGDTMSFTTIMIRITRIAISRPTAIFLLPLPFLLPFPEGISS